ncbi:hypothetical protein B296_00042025 [Ensete ventricosum]|uniref:Uncharacterized protein n=1 Tax=Ensete ventricosum TaxID=4639 RepID=A0A426ZJT0_ENSVE|nr:hypothetical protein B296_00042025 [Ensete ventricosum]
MDGEHLNLSYVKGGRQPLFFSDYQHQPSWKAKATETCSPTDEKPSFLGSGGMEKMDRVAACHFSLTLSRVHFLCLQSSSQRSFLGLLPSHKKKTGPPSLCLPSVLPISRHAHLWPHLVTAMCFTALQRYLPLVVGWISCVQVEPANTGKSALDDLTYRGARQTRANAFVFGHRPRHRIRVLVGETDAEFCRTRSVRAAAECGVTNAIRHKLTLGRSIYSDRSTNGRVDVVGSVGKC